MLGWEDVPLSNGGIRFGGTGEFRWVRGKCGGVPQSSGQRANFIGEVLPTERPVVGETPTFSRHGAIGRPAAANAASA